MTGLRTAPAAIVLLATLVAAIMFTAAPSIEGEDHDRQGFLGRH